MHFSSRLFLATLPTPPVKKDDLSFLCVLPQYCHNNSFKAKTWMVGVCIEYLRFSMKVRELDANPIKNAGGDKFRYIDALHISAHLLFYFVVFRIIP